MEWIIKYAVVAMDTCTPVHGHDQTLQTFNDKEMAIEKAKKLATNRNNICVEKRRYACEENLRKGITFDQGICWACWL